ncbi:hypothetical protein SZ54_2101 [Rhizobium sp. UR51a]|nr:hypothetical protein SZ54_2101 [Rhizobium sp. UR51a]
MLHGNRLKAGKRGWHPPSHQNAPLFKPELNTACRFVAGRRRDLFSPLRISIAHGLDLLQRKASVVRLRAPARRCSRHRADYGLILLDCRPDAFGRDEQPPIRTSRRDRR